MNVELPPLPEPVRTSSDQAYLGYTADPIREDLDAAIDAAIRLTRPAEEA